MSYYRVFACEVLFREICAEAAETPHTIDLSFNRYGLHHVGCERMVAELQALVDSAQDKSYDAILLGYGLCNNGIAGLSSQSVPLVVPRAHDCITLLLGSKETYEIEFNKEPGTYFHSPGWLEHKTMEENDSVANQLGTNLAYQDMVEKYGEENAQYLLETMGNLGTYKETYTRMAYIDTGVGPRNEFIERSQAEAERNGWRSDLIQGDRGLIRRMLNGEWDDENFLVINPGETVKPSYDKSILRSQTGEAQ